MTYNSYSYIFVALGWRLCPLSRIFGGLTHSDSLSHKTECRIVWFLIMMNAWYKMVRWHDVRYIIIIFSRRFEISLSFIYLYSLDLFKDVSVKYISRVPRCICYVICVQIGQFAFYTTRYQDEPKSFTVRGQVHQR